MQFVVLWMCLLPVLAGAGSTDIDPQIYSKLFMNNKPIYDHMAEAIHQKLPAGGRMLDLGSGPGEPSLTLAQRAKDAHIVCTDFQPGMNEKAKARAKAAGVDNIEFAITSADDLSAWSDAEFDAVSMSLVLMFVPDKAKAVREAARVLKPGGYAYTAVWKELPFYDLCHKACEEVKGEALPPFAINPKKLTPRNAVEDLAMRAGLQVVKDEPLVYPFKLGDAKGVADGCQILSGSSLKEMEDTGIHDATTRFYTIVQRMVKEHDWGQQEEISIPGNSPQILTLRKPLKDEL